MFHASLFTTLLIRFRRAVVVDEAVIGVEEAVVEAVEALALAVFKVSRVRKQPLTRTIYMPEYLYLSS